MGGGGESFSSSESRKELHMKSRDGLWENDRPSGCEMEGGGRPGAVSMGFFGRMGLEYSRG